MKIIITDLTRFKNKDLVCTAGVAEDGTVIRPMPYLTASGCKELDIHPGGILEGDFTMKNTAAPHIEDATSTKMTFNGACSKADFQEALEKTCYPTIAEGFGIEGPIRNKFIPIEITPIRSLATIKVNPRSFSVVQTHYDPTKLRAHFSDNGGSELGFVSVADRGFSDYSLENPDDRQKVAELNQFIRSQDELYLRLGVGRPWPNKDGENGHWIQLNGIYTFPEKLEYIRCYE